MMYVLKEEPISREIRSEGYYTGKIYVVQGSTYYVFSHDIEKAKKYSSRKRAENIIESLYIRNSMYNLVIEELKEWYKWQYKK